MTVDELRERMTNVEFVYWTRFFAVRQQSQELANKQAAARAGG